MQPHERIFVAVDTTDIRKALALVNLLKGKVGGFKFGLEFFTSALVQLAVTKDEELFEDLVALLERVAPQMFWDGKFNDIPNTVAGASMALRPLSPRFFNVHANCGVEAMKQAVANKGTSQVLAVTLLTSFDSAAALETFETGSEALVLRWAYHSQQAGVDGLICSPKDLAVINKIASLATMPKMTPGIRPAFSQVGDQKRVMTPAEAVRAGSTWLVIGRPITEHAGGPEKAVDLILTELAELRAEVAEI